jgi:hypothetical protein
VVLFHGVRRQDLDRKRRGKTQPRGVILSTSRTEINRRLSKPKGRGHEALIVLWNVGWKVLWNVESQINPALTI